MNFSFPYYWSLSELPETARNLETGEPVDLSIPIRPCTLQLPIYEERTVERSFPGGTARYLFYWLHHFYHEPVEAIEIAYLIPRTEGAEQERLIRCLAYIKSGHSVNRLELVESSDFQFLGIEEGVVVLGVG